MNYQVTIKGSTPTITATMEAELIKSLEALVARNKVNKWREADISWKKSN